MNVGDFVAEVRRLAADPAGYPAAPDGGGQADDPLPRWARADILRVANARLEMLSVLAPRLFQTGDAYAHSDTAPALTDSDAFDLTTLGIPPLGQALACMTAADLLADILDKGSTEQSAALDRRAVALLEGFLDG